MTQKIVKQIIKIANVLDANLLTDYADDLTRVALKLVKSDDYSYDDERRILEPDSKMLEEFENSEQFLSYQNKVKLDSSYNNQEELKVLEQMLAKVFKDTDMQSFEDEVINTLVERNFESRSPEFTAFEEAYEDVAWDVNNNSQFDDVSRNPIF